MKGPAGYGRYDSSPDWVGCPWSKTSESPCVARDGHLVLVGDSPEVCFCCGLSPEFLAEGLANEYEPAMALAAIGDPVALADAFAAMVREATEPGRDVRG